MIKAVIIDDEVWSRNIIRSLGNWETLGIEIVGEAEDGERGLSLIRDTQPDIIITDMNMPNIDGVSLLKSLSEELIEAKIIVISGHDDFEYMKQAIRSKAFEYLL
ncbi:MAG: response regulator, partial [Vallitaleaceae bacterium]|nr:response regulator [Vallitaleaceae bacterium]